MMIDIDSTLSSAVPIFKREAKALGIDWPTDRYHWITRQYLGVESRVMSKLFARVHSAENVKTLKPYPGSVEALQRLVERFPELDPWYVSNRNLDTKDVLQDWLEEHEFPYAYHVYVSHHKLGWIQKERPAIVVDDRVRTMVLARFIYGAQVFSLIQPWNINLSYGELEGIVLRDDWFLLGAEITTFLADAQPPKKLDRVVSNWKVT